MPRRLLACEECADATCEPATRCWRRGFGLWVPPAGRCFANTPHSCCWLSRARDTDAADELPLPLDSRTAMRQISPMSNSVTAGIAPRAPAAKSSFETHPSPSLVSNTQHPHPQPHTTHSHSIIGDETTLPRQHTCTVIANVRVPRLEGGVQVAECVNRRTCQASNRAPR